MGDHDGMTVNERLFEAHLLADVERAGFARDYQGMVDILKQVEMTQDEAEIAAHGIIDDPERFGYGSRSGTPQG